MRADVNVISLIGERGRELRDFIERDLGPEGLKRSVLIVSTSDQASQLRLNAAYVGTAIAEYFRDQGKSVILMMDSVTRFARRCAKLVWLPASPPHRAGYTPSSFRLCLNYWNEQETRKKALLQLSIPFLSQVMI